MGSDDKVFGLPAASGRWLFVVLGIVMNVCLGAVYAYSIFLKPVKEAFAGISAFQANLPFMVFLAFFSVLMFFGGRVMEKLGPRKLGMIGGIIVGLGWLLSAFASNIWMLTLTYGVIAGSGVGLVYGCPVSMGAKWFPDKKGLAVGLMLAGFGGSALITGKVANALIPSVGLSTTFMYFGIAFGIILVVLSLPFRFPASGWVPAGWKPAAGTVAASDFTSGEMMKTGAFWGLFLCYIIGCVAGLMAIGISKPVGNEIIKISGETAATLVGIFAIFNAVGRPLFGFLTDKITPRNAAILNLLMILIVSIIMITAKEGDTMLYTISFIGFWLGLGGWLAIAPTATASFFGMKNYAQNYGVVFFAYGLGAIIGGIISGQAKDVFGTYTYAFYPTAVLAVVGLVLAVALLKTPKKG
ncbi:MAG: putative MFS-type transporter YhjX [Deltaproteobacteria bacterium ADurb.Bin151]|jgi:MFS transporter, OFA family, oxalate/formate antiporter|nr:OFA family MFS transporter [Smithella sp.]OQB55615.1 MAG: putative MFS-type transporter YhjX [Deltaproteobacteria bacterium ADurb.Bin151]HOQ41024.1 OFA family MFS transporter [Smithellaceae bacterium]HPL66685.1 OFA family MFS transporter [Smithellaceae bacterium]HRY35749.1 OFA family MFS transporter [Smithellaceae bacterium]